MTHKNCVLINFANYKWKGTTHWNANHRNWKFMSLVGHKGEKKTQWGFSSVKLG